MDVFTVAFFGHRYISNLIKVEEKLNIVIETLIKENKYVEVLVGRNGDFDRCVSSAVRNAKKLLRDDNISLVLVLPYLTAEFRDNRECFEKFYDAVEICPKSKRSYYKSAIQIRNRDMVDRSDLVVCYVNRNSGGAYQALRYAEKENKKFFNLSD